MTKKQDSTIMNQQMNALSRPFEKMVDQIFQNFPEKPPPSSKKDKDIEQSRTQYENTIYDYMNQQIVIDSDIGKVIHNASFVSSSQPDSSFSNLVSILPNIKINDKGKPSSIYFNNIKDNIDWDDMYKRSTFQYLVDSLICSFLHNLLLVSVDIKKNECLNIFNLVVESWYPKSPHPPFYERLRLINAKIWAHILYILSTKVPEEVARDLIIKRMPTPNDSDISIQVYLTLSQYIFIGNESKLNYDQLPKKFADLESIAKRSKPKGPIHGPAMTFFTNLMGYLLVNHPQYREHQFIYDLSEIAKNYTTEKNYIGPAYSLRALLYRFTKHKKMKLNLREYYEKYIEKRFIRELAPYHVESCIYFVRGENYAAHCHLEISEENYKWRYSPNEKDTMDYLFQKITLAHDDVYQEAQHQLGEFFTQIACNDFKEFVSKYLPILISNVFSLNNSLSLFIMAHNILSPVSKFSEYAKNGKDQNSINKMKEDMLKLIQDNINLKKQYPSNDIGFYAIPSFIESLNLSSAKETSDKSIIQAKMNACIHSLTNNSIVQSTTIQTGKIPNIKDCNKWMKNTVPDLGKNLFEKVSLDCKFKSAEIKPFMIDRQIEAISILPFLTISKPIIQMLVNDIYTTHCHAGSIALRTLQVFVHLDQRWIDVILTILCTPIAPTVEHQILQLQAISLIVQSGLFVHAKISTEVQQLLFKTLVYSLCSNNADIRSYSLDLANKVSVLGQKKDPDVANFIQVYSDFIDGRLQNLAFSFASFNLDFDVSEVGTIPFSTIAKSCYDNLYLFALESLSNTFRDKSNPADLDSLRVSLTNAIKDVKEMHPITKVNICIFLAGIALDKKLHAGYFTSNIKELHKLIDYVKPIRLVAYSTFYTAFKPDIGITVHAPLVKSEDPFILQVVAFVLRVYIAESTDESDYVTKTSKILLKIYKKKSRKNDWLDDRLEKSQTEVLNQASLLFNTPNDWPLIQEDNKEFIFSLCHFLITLKYLYRELFKDKATCPNGPYARPQRMSFELDSMPDKDDTLAFAFLTNLASIEDDHGLNADLVSLAQSSLNSFIKIYIIPSLITNLLRSNLIKISHISFKSIEMILNSFFVDMIPFYLSNSYTDHTFFQAIAHQFYQDDSMEEHHKVWSKSLIGKMSQQDNHFASATYSNTGILLAFAFFNVTSLNPDERSDGFTVLLNVALGSALVTGISQDEVEIATTKDISNYDELIHSLARLKTLISVQHPQLTENLLVRISKLCKKELSFCTEQFIKTSFELLKQQLHREEAQAQNEVFLHAVVPWIDQLIFNRSDDTILKDCSKDFSCLSTFTFFQMLIENVITFPLNRSHVILIDKILQQPSDGDISTLDFFIITLFKLYQLHVQNTDSKLTNSRKEQRISLGSLTGKQQQNEGCDDVTRTIISVIVYLLGQNKEDVIGIISKYLSFKAWFYYQIQLKKIDTAFDIDEFIKDIVANDEVKLHSRPGMQPKAGPKAAPEFQVKELNTEDEDFYETIIEFTIEIFLEFIKVNKESIISVDYLLVLFSLINYETLEKNKRILQLLSDICGVQKNNFSGAVRAFSMFMTSSQLGTSLKIDNSEPNFGVNPIRRTSTMKGKGGSANDDIDYASDDLSLVEMLTGIPFQNVITAIEYIRDLSPSHLENFCDEALRWAVGCGDIDIATRAAKLYLMFMNSANEDIIQIVIRSIYIVNSIMAERVDPSYKNNAGLLAAIQDNQQPDYAKSIQYMAILLNILNKCHELMKVPNEDTFYVALSFLQFKEQIQMPLVNIALKIIINYFETEQDFIKKVMSKEGKMPNFLRPLIDMNHSETSLELSFKLISILATQYPKSLIDDDVDKFFSVTNMSISSKSSMASIPSVTNLSSVTTIDSSKRRTKIDSNSGFGLLILSLMPYAFINQHEESIKKIMESLSNLANGNGFRDLAIVLRSTLSGSPEEFCKSIMSLLGRVKIVSSDLALVVKFYTSISQSTVSAKASQNLKAMFGPIVSICTILLSNPAFEAPVSLFSDIGHYAICDKDSNRNSLNLDFLAVLTAKKGSASQTKIPKGLKRVPELKLRTLIDLSSWAPTDGVDSFDNVRDYPPLSVISIDYVGCKIQKPISCAVQQVKVEPFSKWTTMMFRAESLDMQMNDIVVNLDIRLESGKAKKVLDIFKKAIVINPDEHFAQDPATALPSPVSVKRAATINLTPKSDQLKIAELIQSIKAVDQLAIPSDETNPYALDQWAARMENKIFSPEEFVPSQDEINSIGSDVVKGIDSLSFFPSVRY
ncbi:hypothetical protein M9Y10_029222 [Tritrichomonas musculus]|uniref:Uncharacterized protein n=1 Tax=Tritrichomonas musculus TaxID=1915356 RepID=A0ABR2KLK6_9EUKA